MADAVLTTQDIMKQYGVHFRTVYNWRRGWYQRGGEQLFLLPDRSHLDFEWNPVLRRIEYNPIKVAVWVNKVKICADNRHTKTLLSIKRTKNAKNKNSGS